MATITMKLEPKPFDAIKSKKKQIELRLYDDKRKNINIGDIIEFKREPERTISIKTRVVALLRYENFSKLFEDFEPSIFGGNNKQELLDGVTRFYSKEKQNEYGILGIKIELL
ncbi:ASCH domain-containing protein [Patescibacteria group bacterium]|nr:ASCH domain-containing protein [Patescibacteria group bacterium]MBU1721878.1 ASCH domain-containing protein [Patescibacteria group bacterium]MBU1901336.1 ASCH domain-containing protein [Patescibacteria group bacterium]